MSLWILFWLGIVQGVTEFLPVSSSGHLVLVQRLFGVQPSLAVNVGLHMGSLVAILYFYRREWIDLVRALVAPVKGQDGESITRADVLHLVLATCATVPVALFLRDPAEGMFQEPAAGRFLALTFFLTAVMLLQNEMTIPATKRMNWRMALVIGLVQGMAVFPGISRSGATIAVAMLLGIPGEKAARFSFLLAVPVIAGAGLLEVPGLAGEVHPGHLAAGMAAALVSGLLCLHLLVRLLRSRRFGWFAAYLVPLALVCLVFNP